MRPEILNPLFAEIEALKGVGPQVAKLLKRIDVTRLFDALYHLPTGAIERINAPAANPALLGRNVILEVTPYQVRENRSGRVRCACLRLTLTGTASASSISTIQAGRSALYQWARSGS